MINKISDVGDTADPVQNPFRTFNYELLAGSPSLDVTVHEEDCTFRFDYSKVYWNSRLHTEHKRLYETYFREGEAVADVMAGVGPFAVPAGKRRVFVWANDLNPESFRSLTDAIKRNKVDQFVWPFCQDGNHFIRDSAVLLRKEKSRSVTILGPKLPAPPATRKAVEVDQKSQIRSSSPPRAPTRTLTRPKTFAHYILNLPASALNFLPSFFGLYAGQQHLFTRFHVSGALSSSVATADKPLLPLVHVYCFGPKDNRSNEVAEQEICSEISRQLKFRFRPREKRGEQAAGELGAAGDGQRKEVSTAKEKSQTRARTAAPKAPILKEGEVDIHDVRDVAPGKRMFAATFRLPGEVAFGEA